MWGSIFSVDSRKNCFITVPHKWGIDLNKTSTTKLQIIKILDPGVRDFQPIYASVIGDTGPSGEDTVILGTHFARINNIKTGKEGVFQVVRDGIAPITAAVAEPASEEDWELLELNLDQIQSELMNRVRVIWKGAKIPIWLSDFVSLTIVIVELEPPCTVGILEADTEIHISPPVKKATSIQQTVNEKQTVASILNQLADRFLPKPPAKLNQDFSKSIRLRVHPIRNEEPFRKYVEKETDIVLQPYQAFVSKALCSDLEDWNCEQQYCLGCLKNDTNVCYFTVVFVNDNPDWQVHREAIYLSNNVIQQLKLNIKQRSEVHFSTDIHRNRIDNITFYTFVNDHDLKDTEKETKLWLQSATEKELSLTLNHGQHLDIPRFVKGKATRVYVGLHPELEYCCIDQITLRKIEDKLKFVRISAKNAPTFLKIPDESHLEPEVEPLRLGGMNNLVNQCLDFLTDAMGLSTAEKSSFAGCRHGNLLLTGSRGSGKSHIARYLSYKLTDSPHFVFTVYVNCTSLRGKKIETLHREWQSIFQQLQDKEPSMLILDDLDLLAPCPQNDHDDGLNGENWYSTRVAELLWDLVNSVQLRNQIIIVATAANSKSLHPKLNHYKSKHLFSCEIAIPPLTLAMRVEVLRVVFQTSGIAFDDDDNDVIKAAKQMDTYTAADIKNVAEKAAHLALSESSISEVQVKARHLEAVVSDHVPFGLFGINFKPPTEHRKSWDDVGGLSEAKQMLLETLKWPTQYPELFSHCPIRLRSALLLYGAPGTGKTLLASAVATECSVNFISIKGPELLSKYIGASEEAVRETFRRARSVKPCILFFDEFDSLAPRRGHDSTGVTDRVVNQLLTELDGVEGQEVGLWVLAATSRPDLIDPALLRPGRFDVAVNCPLPNKTERLEILKALSTRLQFTDEVQLESISEEAQHFSGADLQALLYTAQLKALHRERHALNDERQLGTIRITQENLVAALRETRPSVSALERQRYDQIYEKFQAGRSRNADHTNAEPMVPSRVTLA